MHAAHERYLIFERYVQLLSPLLLACASEITCFLVDCAWALRPVGLPDSPGNARDRSDGKSAGDIRDARRVNLAAGWWPPLVTIVVRQLTGQSRSRAVSSRR